MNALITDPNAICLLTISFVLIVGRAAMRLQDKFEKERSAKRRKPCP
ncbi:hypothetical protein [Acidovorax sp. sic0104]|nr:hypothetical protein [Acidovorax sp. sic0104]MBV7541941.1 hypothetical protein [Acidovorax sp. sic0104]